MKTRRTNRKGFILLLAVAMIPMVAIALLLLSGGTRIMADQERLARREACRRDLFASAEAWASHNRARLAGMKVGDTQPLDVTEFGLKYAACSIRLAKVTEGEIHLLIEVRVEERGRPRTNELSLKVEGLAARPDIDAAPRDPNSITVPTSAGAETVTGDAAHQPGPPDPNSPVELP